MEKYQTAEVVIPEEHEGKQVLTKIPDVLKD